MLVLVIGQAAGACSPVQPATPRPAATQPASPASPDQAPVAQWQLFAPPDRSFSVRLPGVPVASREATQTNYLVRIGRDVTYSVLAGEPGIFPASFAFQKELEEFRDAALEPLRPFGGRLLWSETGRSPSSQWPCITFLAEATPKGFPRTRLLSRIILDIGDVRIFTLTHSAPAEAFQEAKAKDFLASFSLP